MRQDVVLLENQFSHVLSLFFDMITANLGGISLFNEKDYLSNNADVREEVNKSCCCSGYYHWIQFGSLEGRCSWSEESKINTLGLEKNTRLLLIAFNSKNMSLVKELFEQTSPSFLRPLLETCSLKSVSHLRKRDLHKSGDTSLDILIYMLVFLLIYIQNARPFNDTKKEILFFLKCCRSFRSRADSPGLATIYWWGMYLFSIFCFFHGKIDIAARINEFIYKSRQAKVPEKDRRYIADQCPYEIIELSCLTTAYLFFISGQTPKGYAYYFSFFNSIMSFHDHDLRNELRQHNESLVHASVVHPATNCAQIFLSCLSLASQKTSLDPGQAAFFKSLLKCSEVHSLIDLPKPVKRNTDPSTSDYVFAIGDFSETKRYRVFNIIDELESTGKTCTFMRHDDVDVFLESMPRFSVLMLMRCANFEHIQRLVVYAKQIGSKLIYDIDDLFYDSTYAHEIRGINNIPSEKRYDIYKTIELFRSCIPLADIATAPTRWLVQHLSTLNIPAKLYRNSIGKLEHFLAEMASCNEHVYFCKMNDAVYIGYFSGSWTHDVDFDECLDSLTQIMSTCDNVHYVDTGYVSLPASWEQFKNRVHRFWAVPHSVMMLIQSQCDIVIAPLEQNNTFCLAKSELKYFEAAASGVAIITSPTPPMAEVISDGVNGFLASSPEDWLHKLRLLIENPELRKAMGEAARKSSADLFSSKQASRDFLTICNALSYEKFQTSMQITFICTDYCKGSGGQRNICNLSQMLTAFGHKVLLVMKDSTASPYHIKDLLTEEYGYIPFAVATGDCAPGGDVIIATHNSTVDYCLLHKHKYKQMSYYVQDFEPWFYSIGDDYFKAEQSYYLTENIVTYTSFVKNLLSSEYGIAASSIGMFIDRTVYYKRKRTYKAFNILVFSRPEMPRRCFSLVNEALFLTMLQAIDIHVRFFGSDMQPSCIRFPHEWLGVFTDYNKLAELYSNSDIGISISPTNPSHMPYEMMACGLPVVDIHWKNSKYNDSPYYQIATTSAPNPRDLSNALLHLIANERERREKSDLGIRMVQEANLLSQTAREFEAFLLKLCASKPTQA